MVGAKTKRNLIDSNENALNAAGRSTGLFLRVSLSSSGIAIIANAVVAFATLAAVLLLDVDTEGILGVLPLVLLPPLAWLSKFAPFLVAGWATLRVVRALREVSTRSLVSAGVLGLLVALLGLLVQAAILDLGDLWETGRVL